MHEHKDVLDFNNVRRGGISLYSPQIDQIEVCITYNPPAPTKTGFFYDSLVSQIEGLDRRTVCQKSTSDLLR